MRGVWEWSCNGPALAHAGRLRRCCLHLCRPPCKVWSPILVHCISSGASADALVRRSMAALHTLDLHMRRSVRPLGWHVLASMKGPALFSALL